MAGQTRHMAKLSFAMVAAAILGAFVGTHAAHAGTTREFLYVANFTSGDVATFRINTSTGALTKVGGNVASGSEPLGIAADSANDFVYVANFGSNDLVQYSIQPADGSLQQVVSRSAGAGAFSVTVAPSGDFVYMANETSDDVSVFSLNSGQIQFLKGVSAGAAPGSVILNPGKFAYVADQNSNDISAYGAGSDGTLSPLSDSPFRDSGSPIALVSTPNSKFVYAANHFGNSISGFRVNQSSGALTPLNHSPFAAGSSPRFIAIDPKGKFLYVADENATHGICVLGFSVAGNGAIKPLAKARGAGHNATGVTVDPSGKFLYASDFDDSSVLVFLIKGTTLTPRGSVSLPGANPVALVAVALH